MSAGKLRKLGPESLKVLRAAFEYRTSPIAIAARYWDLYRNGSFAPHEIHFFRLLDPSLTPVDLQRVVSKERLLQLQLQLNDPALHRMTEDKLQFDAHCSQHDLPAPRILAVTGREKQHDAAITLLASQPEVEKFLGETSDDILIFKPVHGVNGEGVTRLERDARGWRDASGRRVDGARLLAVAESSDYPCWMFQEFVHGHPVLNELSSTNGLQTMRVITALEADGSVRTLAMRLRLICSDVAFDNFNYGETGNVIANVDIETGKIRSVVRNEAGTMCYVETHPRTGKALLGYQVPQCEEAKALAEQAARAFAPLKTVGWDIGLSLPGPRLIEGNVTWGILSGEPRLGEIYRYLSTLQ